MIPDEWHPCFGMNSGNVILNLDGVIGDNGYDKDLNTGLKEAVTASNEIRVVFST